MQIKNTLEYNGTINESNGLPFPLYVKYVTSAENTSMRINTKIMILISNSCMVLWPIKNRSIPRNTKSKPTRINGFFIMYSLKHIFN